PRATRFRGLEMAAAAPGSFRFSVDSRVRGERRCCARWDGGDLMIRRPADLILAASGILTAACWLLFRAQQIHKHSDGSGHSRRKLAKERISAVNIRSFAVASHQQPAFLWWLAGIIGREQRLEMVVPLRHEVQAPFLDPSIEIFGRNFVGIRKDWILRLQNFYRHLLY